MLIKRSLNLIRVHSWTFLAREKLNEKPYQVSQQVAITAICSKKNYVCFHEF